VFVANQNFYASFEVAKLIRQKYIKRSFG
jgi:hypothetical protein